METGHGCAPLPVTRAMIGALQRTDPRCGNQPISPEDAEAIKQLEQLLKAPGDISPKPSQAHGRRADGHATGRTGNQQRCTICWARA